MYQLRLRIDPYDKEILNSLKGGKSKNFQILEKIAFSYNTLRLHLNSLVDKGTRCVVKFYPPESDGSRQSDAVAAVAWTKFEGHIGID